jgi:hypothetical protein
MRPIGGAPNRTITLLLLKMRARTLNAEKARHLKQYVNSVFGYYFAG